MDEHDYCTARVIRECDPLRETTEVLSSFGEVEVYLRAVYDWFIEVIIERSGVDPAWEADLGMLGGFGVQLKNRWRSVVEVGAGRRFWFLHRHEPGPGRTFSDHPELEGDLVFYLDGWHRTELDRTQLVSRGACLGAMRIWLDENRFPERRGPNAFRRPH